MRKPKKLSDYDAKEVQRFMEYLSDKRNMEPIPLLKKWKDYLNLSEKEALAIEKSLRTTLPRRNKGKKMINECPWCEHIYDITPETEKRHLKSCTVFQTLPVAETTPEGKTFVEHPTIPGLFIERVRIQ